MSAEAGQLQGAQSHTAPDNVKGGSCIQTAGGLIQEQQLGLSQQLAR